MNSVTLHPASSLSGTLTIPGDKSISHRAVILGSLAEGNSVLSNLLIAEDVVSSMKALSLLGVRFSPSVEALKAGDLLTIHGRGLEAFRKPDRVIDCENSGTTMRLLIGLLAAQSFTSTLTGDASLNRRPMDRVMAPLKQMGGKFSVEQKEERRLITVCGTGKIKGGKFALPVASAQLKSALLIAGLYGVNKTEVGEPSQSRDHTERMLKTMGASLSEKGGILVIRKGGPLKPLKMTIPGDLSSAAFFIVAALIVPRSQLRIESVGMNPTRSAAITVLQKMGGKIVVENGRTVSGEPVADLVVSTSPLKGTRIEGETIPWLIDEIPVLAVAALFAEGKTVIADAAELRSKESDRIKTMASELKIMGGVVTEKEDGMTVVGREGRLKGGCRLSSHADHRVAMSLAVASLKAEGETVIEDVDCVKTSFPDFFKTLHQVAAFPP